MNDLVTAPGDELAGLSIAVTGADDIVYRQAWGRRRIAENGDLPMLPNTICRVASISKMVVALTACELERRGVFDLSVDISEYLDFPLRNPNFPEQRINATQLLSHTSSLRDNGGYLVPMDRPIRSLFSQPGAEKSWSSQNPPGTYFAYCNLGFGVLATVMEGITGKRFDRLAKDLVLEPLQEALGDEQLYGKASFNVQDFTEEELRQFATLYRKMDDAGIWNSSPEAPWIAQCDDYKDLMEAVDNTSLYESYVLGTNGTFLSPQGGLRASAVYLTGLARLFLHHGAVNGNQVLPSSVIEKMTTGQWTFDPSVPQEPGDVEMDWGYTRLSGSGIFQILNQKDRFGCDSFLPEGGPRCWGHQGDAHGLKGGLFFDWDKKLGFAYLVTGSARDPEKVRGRWSNYSLMEETIISEIVKTFW